MANLLPPEVRARLLWQRRVRRAVVLLITGLLGLALATFALLPVAIYTQIIRVGINSNAEVIDTSNAGKQRQELVRKLNKTKSLVDQVSLIVKMPEFGKVFSGAIATLNTINDAELRSIAISSDLEDEGTYTVKLSGITGSRESIFAIKGAFEKDDNLTISNFPADNLTSKGDEYNFVIELSTLKRKSDE